MKGEHRVIKIVMNATEIEEGNIFKKERNLPSGL